MIISMLALLKYYYLFRDPWGQSVTHWNIQIIQFCCIGILTGYTVSIGH